MAISFQLNGQRVSVDADPQTPLLWVIRDELKLTATKYGCGKALCGACTLHVDGQSMRSCSLPLAAAADKNVVTLEGIPENHPVKQAWIQQQVPQCGYCQNGFMMAAVSLLRESPNPSKEVVQQTITNICRCGTQARILNAILQAAKTSSETRSK